MLKIAGKLSALGQIAASDIPPDTHEGASAMLLLPNGRTVVIQGLTREECRSLGGDFGEPMTLKLEGVPV